MNFDLPRLIIKNSHKIGDENVTIFYFKNSTVVGPPYKKFKVNIKPFNSDHCFLHNQIFMRYIFRDFV